MLKVVVLDWGKNCNSGLGQKLWKYNFGVAVWGWGAGGDSSCCPRAFSWVNEKNLIRMRVTADFKSCFNLTFLSGRKTSSCLFLFCWFYFVLFHFVDLILFVFMAPCWSFLVSRHWELFCWTPVLCRTQVPGLLCNVSMSFDHFYC